MSSERLLAAVMTGALGAVITLMGVLRDIRGPKKRESGTDTGSFSPQVGERKGLKITEGEEE